MEAKSRAISKSREEGDIDFALWSDKRVAAYEESLGSSTDIPIAVLAVPRLHIKAAVFNGTEDLTLNRGVGRIIGTAKPGQSGNIAIAGHRDGFFRGLKDAEVGDTIDLVTPQRTYRYSIESTQIVNPDDVSVLQPTSRPSLTLVTCYPFYFIGHAPQRYIVHASITGFDEFQREISHPGSTVKKINAQEDKR
ncbi:MAG: class D sortase [Acidobacteria bacterium]|nr:class D sortase [Acidobacteriota bacterium]MBS1867965.1 class D sortase [Acidobacteriota bacterium]